MDATTKEPDRDAAKEREQKMAEKVTALENLQRCEDALVQAKKDFDTALVSEHNAATALRTVAEKDALFDAIEKKLGISALGLSQATAQLRTDGYAQFIRRLLGT